MTSDEYYGHVTNEDGTHVPLTADEAKSLWDAAMDAKEARATEMPDTDAALGVLHRGLERLRELGWREGKYCPKDGTPFAVIEYGSTGIFEGWYLGKWPDGSIYCCDYLTHPHGILFKPLSELTEAEQLKKDECMGREKAVLERVIQSLLSSD